MACTGSPGRVDQTSRQDFGTVCVSFDLVFSLFCYLIEVVGAFCELWSQQVLAPVNSELCGERLREEDATTRHLHYLKKNNNTQSSVSPRFTGLCGLGGTFVPPTRSSHHVGDAYGPDLLGADQITTKTNTGIFESTAQSRRNSSSPREETCAVW